MAFDRRKQDAIDQYVKDNLERMFDALTNGIKSGHHRLVLTSIIAQSFDSGVEFEKTPKCEDCGVFITSGHKCYTCWSMREGESGR